MAVDRGDNIDRPKLKKGAKNRPNARPQAVRLSANQRDKRNPRPPRSVRESELRKKQIGYRQPRGVSVTVNIRPFRLPARVSIIELVRKYFWQISVCVIALAVLFGLLVLWPARHQSGKVTDNSGANALPTSPDFKPLIPADVTASQQQFDPKRNLVTYTTTFSGVRLTVSQQTLPARFVKDPGAIVGAADSIQAKQRITTSRGTLYIATNEKSGDQLALFANKELLLFIHSDRKMDDVSWKSFIENLKQP